MRTNFILGSLLLFSPFAIAQTNLLLPTASGTANNTVIGTNLSVSSTGSNNVFIGFLAGTSNTTGNNNLFSGFHAGQQNINGINNVFLGSEAGSANIGGNSNVFVGWRSGRSNTKGNWNVFIGRNAGVLDTIGSQNVYVGTDAGSSNGNADYGVFVGAYAGLNSTKNGNTFVGNSAGRSETIGEGNTYLGVWAGREASGNNNIFIGNGVGRFTSGSSNVLIGTFAGRDVVGDKNIFIGDKAGSTLTTSNNLLYIENSTRTNPIVYGNLDANVRELIFNAKKVGIGFEGSSGNENFGSFPPMTGLSNASIYRLFVNGGILAKEVRIRLDVWADYVFAKDYKLLSLKDTEKYIEENGHLPNMPSSNQVQVEGIEIGNIVTIQQEKIEELTLYLIEQQKQIEELKAQVKALLNK